MAKSFTYPDYKKVHFLTVNDHISSLEINVHEYSNKIQVDIFIKKVSKNLRKFKMLL